MLHPLVINPNTVGTSFAWMLLLSCLGLIAYFVIGANKTAKAERIKRNNDIWERGH